MKHVKRVIRGSIKLPERNLLEMERKLGLPLLQSRKKTLVKRLRLYNRRTDGLLRHKSDYDMSRMRSYEKRRGTVQSKFFFPLYYRSMRLAFHRFDVYRHFLFQEIFPD